MAAQPAPLPPDDLAAVKEQLKAQQLQLDYAAKYQSVLDDVREVKATVKIAAWVGSLMLALLTWLGLDKWNDINSRVNDQVNHHVQESKEFYDDLMTGSALIARKQFAAAVPTLIRPFNKGHIYDKGLLIPLLTALDASDDWEEARVVIGKLQTDPKQFEEIGDASVYTMIAAMEIQMAVTDMGAAYDPQSEAGRNMDQGLALLKRAPSVPPHDSETNRQILTNYWIYYLAREQYDESGKMIESLNALPPEVKVYSWKHMSKWKCMVALAKHKGVTEKAEQQWNRLRARFLPD